MPRHRSWAARALTLAATLTLVAACSGGGSDAPAESKAPARVGLTDLAASASAPSASYDAPIDLKLPDESWRDSYRQVSGRLSSMLRTSMTDPAAWRLTSDKEAYELVYGEFDVTETSGRQVADGLYKQARAGAQPRERIGHRIASIFPKDARPRRVHTYKVGWRAREVKGRLLVAAQAWVGYDVGGTSPVLVARELDVTVTRTGTGVNYQISSPSYGTQTSVCSAPVKGVLRASKEAVDREWITAWKKETGSSTVRPLLTAFRKVAATGGQKASVAKTRATAKKCLADAAAKS